MSSFRLSEDDEKNIDELAHRLAVIIETDFALCFQRFVANVLFWMLIYYFLKLVCFCTCKRRRRSDLVIAEPYYRRHNPPTGYIQDAKQMDVENS